MTIRLSKSPTGAYMWWSATAMIPEDHTDIRIATPRETQVIDLLLTGLNRDCIIEGVDITTELTFNRNKSTPAVQTPEVFSEIPPGAPPSFVPEQQDLVCYVRQGWDPKLRPGSSKRDWMDRTPHQYAYRCLPLSIANAHGWEVLLPCGFQAMWNGGSKIEDVLIECDAGMPEVSKPIGLFGSGIMTIHMEGLFRTPKGWNLMVMGSPNYFRDAVQNLTGVVETDWSPFSFTINLKFTRPFQWVRFNKDESIAFLMPVPKSGIEQMNPKIVPLASDPQLEAQYVHWSQSRDAHSAQMKAAPHTPQNHQWQKFYMRGTNSMDVRATEPHATSVKLKPFI